MRRDFYETSYELDAPNGALQMKCFVLGTRPEWIHLKAYLDHERLERRKYYVLSTGQHSTYEMAQEFIRELRLPSPDRSLGSERISILGMASQVSEVVSEQRIDEILVIGDTDSALAGALAAYQTKKELVHIEAGLRCFQRTPEELNRRCIDSLGTKLLAPEEYARDNLIREHVQGKVIRSPNFKVQLFRKMVPEAKKCGPIFESPYAVLTLHRQENVDSKARFEQIMGYVKKTRMRVLWPIHPRASDRLNSLKIQVPENVTVTAPLSYTEMTRALLWADRVMTDSGGLVLEACELAKPCTIFRKAVEWTHVLRMHETTLC